MAINETVLEMHFHKALMDAFRNRFGLGGSRGVNFYKYSPQKEAFVGFDQAYVKTTLSEDAFFRELRNSATQQNYRLAKKYIGFYFQFKVVKEMQNRSRITPTSIFSKPHYRVALDTTKNDNTGLSQHELLYNLSRNLGAFVFYACPMLFDKSELYAIDADLSTLRQVDLASCPSDFSDNFNHYIYFNAPDSVPIWCSDPVEGKSENIDSLLDRAFSFVEDTDPSELAERLLEELTKYEQLGLSGKEAIFDDYNKTSAPLKILSPSLTIMEIQQADGDNVG